MRFADIIGQQALRARLAECIDRGRVSHAQLFAGPAGAGALPLAVAYVQYLNCTDRRDGDSCGRCANCVQIAQLAHPDLHFVFPVNRQGKKSGEAVRSDEFLPLWRSLFAETGGYFGPRQWYDRLDLGRTLRGMISAREADEVIRKLSFKSYDSAYKSVILCLPETMNEEAANKLLKILEEPWDKTLFLLVCEQPERLLETIRSRTQEVAVPPLDGPTLEGEALRRGVADSGKARTLARLSGGDAIRLAQLVSGEGDEQRRDDFALFCSLMRLSYNDRHLELIGWAEDAAQLTREQQRALLLDTARLLRESYVLHAGVPDICYLWGEEADFCRKFAPFIGNDNIEPLLAEIETALAQISQNGNPTIVFTHFALSVSKMINKR